MEFVLRGDEAVRGYPELTYTSRYTIDRGPMRLPVEWHQKRIKVLQAKMREANLEGFVLREAPNVIYFTGLFLSVTERPFFLVIPAEGEPTFFAPWLDVDLLNTWWVKDYETYFDFPHAEGDWDNPGPTVDLLQWMAKEIKQRGLGGGRLGFDKSVSRDEIRRLEEILPELECVDAGAIPLGMRMVKTPEELDLIRRAVTYGDKVMEYAVELLRQWGPALHDYDVGRMAKAYGEDLIYGDIELDGRPHNGSGSGMRFCSVRAGRVTAYPHPNQPYRKKIEKGDAVQIALVTAIGGHSAEYYRGCHIAPMDDHAQRLWEAHSRVTKLQAELSKEGVTCSDVAQGCLSLYRELGVDQYVYHRPGHGQGMEGHQAPFISLGDRTVLVSGMCFSNEPGLYDPATGVGYNHGNVIIVGQETGELPNRYPLELEDCLITW